MKTCWKYCVIIPQKNKVFIILVVVICTFCWIIISAALFSDRLLFWWVAVNTFMSGVQDGVPPSHHQRSPSPFLLDSFNFTPHTCHSSHVPSYSPSPWTPHSRPSAWLDYSHLCMFMCVCVCWQRCFVTSTCYRVVLVLRSGHQHCIAVCGVPFLYFACWPLLLN